jgi:hypothetical protein
MQVLTPKTVGTGGSDKPAQAGANRLLVQAKNLMLTLGIWVRAFLAAGM